jgi:hypothetical protein
MKRRIIAFDRDEYLKRPRTYRRTLYNRCGYRNTIKIKWGDLETSHDKDGFDARQFILDICRDADEEKEKADRAAMELKNKTSVVAHSHIYTRTSMHPPDLIRRPRAITRFDLLPPEIQESILDLVPEARPQVIVYGHRMVEYARIWKEGTRVMGAFRRNKKDAVKLDSREAMCAFLLTRSPSPMPCVMEWVAFRGKERPDYTTPSLRSFKSAMSYVNWLDVDHVVEIQWPQRRSKSTRGWWTNAYSPIWDAIHEPAF